MDYIETRNKTVTSFLWKFFERFSVQIASLIFSIILARLVEPSEYGVVAIVVTITNFLGVFVDGGLEKSLIQKKDADDLDFSSFYIFILSLCATIYIVLFLLAPVFADFYDNQMLVELIRFNSLIIIFYGIKNVQNAYIARNLMFKKSYYATSISVILSFVIGIILAMNKFGVWALEAQNVLCSFFDVLFITIFSKWFPKINFSLERLKGLLNFGWKIFMVSLCTKVYSSLRKLIIGKKYTSADLAFFEKGEAYPLLIENTVNSSVGSVLLPIMSKEQNNKKTLVDITSRTVKMCSYFITPLMIGLFVCANQIVEILLTAKWLPCVPYLRIYCIYYLFYPIVSIKTNSIVSLGKSEISLRNHIITMVVNIALLLPAVKYGVYAIAVSLLIGLVVTYVVNMYSAKKEVGYLLVDQIKDILPPLFISIIMGCTAYLVSFINVGILTKLVMQIVVGAVVYILMSYLFRVDSFLYCLDIIQNMISSKKK